MHFDFETLPPRQRYKLLTATVVPRPIALVTTLHQDGTVNAAPFSFFNVFSEDPALVVLGLEGRHEGGYKHTTNNIFRSGEFTVNLVDEAIAEAMVVCAARAPDGVSELPFAGLTAAASGKIQTPRIAEAPVSLECRSYDMVKVSDTRVLAIGEVVAMHARDGLIDPQTGRLNWDLYTPIGRLYGDHYVRTGDRFDMTIPGFADGVVQPAKPAKRQGAPDVP